MKKESIKTGIIGKLADEPFVVYCNEKERKEGQFLFSCCYGCKHNPFKK